MVSEKQRKNPKRGFGRSLGDCLRYSLVRGRLVVEEYLRHAHCEEVDHLHDKSSILNRPARCDLAVAMQAAHGRRLAGHG